MNFYKETSKILAKNIYWLKLRVQIFRIITVIWCQTNYSQPHVCAPHNAREAAMTKWQLKNLLKAQRVLSDVISDLQQRRASCGI